MIHEPLTATQMAQSTDPHKLHSQEVADACHEAQDRAIIDAIERDSFLLRGGGKGRLVASA